MESPWTIWLHWGPLTLTGLACPGWHTRLIRYQADGVKLGDNPFFGQREDLCNISRGGGTFGGS